MYFSHKKEVFLRRWRVLLRNHPIKLSFSTGTQPLTPGTTLVGRVMSPRRGGCRAMCSQWLASVSLGMMGVSVFAAQYITARFNVCRPCLAAADKTDKWENIKLGRRKQSINLTPAATLDNCTFTVTPHYCRTTEKYVS